jgi:hypothetical protein
METLRVSQRASCDFLSENGCEALFTIACKAGSRLTPSINQRKHCHKSADGTCPGMRIYNQRYCLQLSLTIFTFVTVM